MGQKPNTHYYCFVKINLKKVFFKKGSEHKANEVHGKTDKN